MKAVIRTQAKVPKGKPYECVDVCLEVDMPFIPTNGMALKVTKDGEYMTIDEVMWDVDKPDLLDIYMVDLDIDNVGMRPLKEMKQQGWKEY